MRLHLHIERLVLEGMPVNAAQGEEVRLAVETALAEKFMSAAAAARWTTGAALDRVAGASLPLTGRETPTGLADGIARSLHASCREVLSAQPTPASANPHPCTEMNYAQRTPKNSVLS
jgi:hypothetical protein